MIHHYFHQYIPKGRETESEAIKDIHLSMFDKFRMSTHVNILEEGQLGFEMVTLKLMQSNLHRYADNDLIFYAHTKGISRNVGEDYNLAHHWRESMQNIMLRGLNRGIQPLTAWGGFLLEAKVFNSITSEFGEYDFFGGNFWLARVGFLKTLPEVDLTADRYFAERWVGLTRANLESPNRNDWPSYAAFHRLNKLEI